MDRVRVILALSIMAYALVPLASTRGDAIDDAAAVLNASPSSDDEVVAACNALGKAGGARAGKALLEYLQANRGIDYQHPHASAALADALSRVGGTQIEAGLLALLPSVKGFWQENWLIVAARSLATMKSARAAKPLLAALQASDSYDGDAWDAVMESLAKIGDRTVADGVASAMKEVSVSSFRSDARMVAAIRCLGTLGSGKHINALLPFLSTVGPDVRAAALDALTQLSWAPATEEDRAWRALAARDWAALTSLGQKAIPALVLCTNDFRPAEEAQRILLGLGAPAIAALVAGSAQENMGIWHDDNFAAILVRFGAASWDPLIAALSAKSYRERSIAVMALGALEDSRAIALIVNFLTTELSQDSSRTAAEALAHFGASGGEPLYPLLSGRDDKARYWAAFVFRSGVPASETRLIDIGRGSKNAEVRGACAWVLFGLGTAAGRAVAVELLGSDPAAATSSQLATSKNLWLVLSAISVAEEKALPESYLNSKDERLAAAAELWARDHGYTITVGPS